MCFVLLQVSYFEIYMDKIRDLLDGEWPRPLVSPCLMLAVLVVNVWMDMPKEVEVFSSNDLKLSSVEEF